MISRSDIVIVGGGLAGLSAAAAAAEQGVQVTVFEQGAEELYPCNSRYAGGMMHLAFVDMGLAPDALEARLLAKRTEGIDASLLGLVAAHSRSTLEWLQDKAGARFIKAGAEPWQKWCLAPIRPRRSGLVWTGRGPDKVLRGLEQYLKTLGGRVLRGHKVKSISAVDGGYEVSVETAQGCEKVTCSTVILSEGGFQNNARLMQAHIAPQPAATLQRNAGTAKGFAMEMAERMGLKVSQTHRFYGHIVSAGALTDTRLWPWPTFDELAMSGMLIDQTGRDVGADLKGGVAMANAIAAASGSAQFFVVVDDRIWSEIAPYTRVIPCNPFLDDLGAPVHKGNRLLDAAAGAGIDPAVLERSVACHNDRVSAGGSVRSISQGPYRIFPVIAGVTYTMSGLEVNADLNAIDFDNRPVRGLYAAGATVGGLEGGKDTFYLGGLAKAAILGRLAGLNAAASIKGV